MQRVPVLWLCNYYVAGDKSANTLVEKYDRCVDECPPELPVHKDGEKQCMTCAAATNGQKPYKTDLESHTIDKCSDKCFS